MTEEQALIEEIDRLEDELGEMRRDRDGLRVEVARLRQLILEAQRIAEQVRQNLQNALNHTAEAEKSYEKPKSNDPFPLDEFFGDRPRRDD